MKDANDWVAQPHPEDVKRIEERRFVRLTDEEKNVLFNRVVMEGLTINLGFSLCYAHKI